MSKLAFRYFGCCVLAFLLACGSEKTADNTVRPLHHETYEVRIPLTGMLNAVDSTLHSSLIPNKNMKITWLVDEGIFVQKGDQLVVFDDSELRLELDNLEKELAALEEDQQKVVEEHELNQLAFHEMLEEARFNTTQAGKKLQQFTQFTGPARLKQLEQESHLAHLKAERLEQEAEDLKLLKEKGYVTAFELQTQHENLLQARYKRDKSQLELRNYTASGMHDERVALESERNLVETRLAQLEAKYTLFNSQFQKHEQRFLKNKRRKHEQIAQKREEIARTRLAANHEGLVIYHKSFRQGKEIKPSVGFEYRRAQPILQVQNTARLFAETRVNEYLLNRIKVGQTVSLVADARMDQPFTGRVSFIGFLAEMKNNDAEKAFDMNIEIQDPPEGLRPGMSVRCEVVTSTFGNIWTLPRNGLTQSDEQTFCRILRSGRELAVAVEVLEFDRQTAILQGELTADDVVFLN